MSFIDSLFINDSSAAATTAATGTGNTSFWGGLVDDFSTIADAAIKYEQAKNPANEGVAQTVQLATTNERDEPNPEITTANASQFASAYAINPQGGVTVDKTMLYIGGAVLAGILLVGVLK